MDNPAPSLLERDVVQSTSWQAAEERRAGAFPCRVLSHLQQKEPRAPCLALPAAVITPRPGADKPWSASTGITGGKQFGKGCMGHGDSWSQLSHFLLPSSF